MQRRGRGRRPAATTRPALNDQQTMASTAEDMVRWYQQALRGAFFKKPETLLEFKRIQAMADAIVHVVPPDTIAYAKGGSIEWAGFHCFSLPGQMIVGKVPVTFCFTINWTGPDDGVRRDLQVVRRRRRRRAEGSARRRVRTRLRGHELRKFSGDRCWPGSVSVRAAPPRRRPPATDEAAIRDALVKWTADFNARDATRTLALLRATGAGTLVLFLGLGAAADRVLGDLLGRDPQGRLVLLVAALLVA